ncbi:hypothetical protein CK203_052878 [Vitis vinifera]|uniref:Uncharacterized protein n=1 Tax=Vitis vinifera TaxID=29760 RepID=A0A438H866_VITVI|nr:hypothetical protein CK203_052878 [Vitis vinifera]
MRSTHRDALIQSWSQIRVKTTTTPEGLIHMMIAGRATCIVFSDDDLPLENNGSALNIYPLTTSITIGYAPSDFVPSTQNGQPWIHKAGAISSFLHQNVKFIHDGKVITVHSIGDIFASSSQCFRSAITHSEGVVSGLSVVQEVKVQHIVHQLQLSDGAPGIFAFALVVLTSLDHMSLLTLYFMEEVVEYGTFIEIGDKVDGVVSHDEYIDEMLAMGMSQIDGII